MQKQIIILLAAIVFGLNQPAVAQTQSQSFTGVMPILNVSSVEKSIEYYTTVLGFTKIYDWPEEEVNKIAGEIRNGKASIFLVENEQGARPVWIYYTVNDVDTLHVQYKAAGAKIIKPPTDQAWQMREMLVEDIDGHVLRIGTPIGQQQEERKE